MQVGVGDALGDPEALEEPLDAWVVRCGPVFEADALEEPDAPLVVPPQSPGATPSGPNWVSSTTMRRTTLTTRATGDRPGRAAPSFGFKRVTVRARRRIARSRDL